MTNERKARDGRRERRKRGDIDGLGQKLAVNTENLDMQTYQYRFVNDDPTRIQKFTNLDWDFVPQDESAPVKDDNTDLGSVVSVVVGKDDFGNPKRAYLMRKYRDWYDDDQKEKQDDLDEQLARMRRGETPKGEKQADYVPEGAIQIA